MGKTWRRCAPQLVLTHRPHPAERCGSHDVEYAAVDFVLAWTRVAGARRSAGIRGTSWLRSRSRDSVRGVLVLRDGLCLKERVLNHYGLLHDEERRFGGHNLHCGAYSLCRSYERGLRFDLMDVTLRADAIHRGAGKFVPAVIAHLCHHEATTSCWLTEVSFLLIRSAVLSHTVSSL